MRATKNQALNLHQVNTEKIRDDIRTRRSIIKETKRGITIIVGLDLHRMHQLLWKFKTNPKKLTKRMLDLKSHQTFTRTKKFKKLLYRKLFASVKNLWLLTSDQEEIGLNKKQLQQLYTHKMRRKSLHRLPIKSNREGKL